MTAQITSVYLDTETKRKLSTLARKNKVSRSEMIRALIHGADAGDVNLSRLRELARDLGQELGLK